jgi:hypothetical protein
MGREARKCQFNCRRDAIAAISGPNFLDFDEACA